MIVVRKTENSEENAAIAEMSRGYKIDNNMSDNSVSYVLEDNGKIVGGCNISINNDYAILNFLMINENKRGDNLGDGLLRAVLNYCLINGIKKAFFIGDNQYFIKKGFSKAKKIDEKLALTAALDTDIILACNIEEFFKKGCCSCRRS
ncbi:GNAT family N-acetyltransferase [Proteiniborus sp. MB09-C3]|uniref:GNAT family N-acetyltransferase n=1 Tax=Proteiniborus sp. MB09-C3 TaxID=3050072 RepID=UPI002554E4B2|nr:GNAT family N-acetyltransferase [Proteiniborus sp. MB09-C3]WIV10963.1 GNAT family N-acetyltransferase [Proteiniborus sp. MB09-C3]